MLQLAIVVFLIAAVGVAIVWRGFVLSVLWAWFLVPLGAPAIGIALAVGLTTTWAILSPHPFRKAEQHDKQLEVWSWLFMFPLIGLAMGWVVKQFL